MQAHDGPAELIGLDFSQRYDDGRVDLLTVHPGIEANTLQLHLQHMPTGDVEDGMSGAGILLDRPAIEALRQLCEDRLNLVDPPFNA
jgi:L-asparaginase/Glu-tRNA(Gln) amidotransferase subunit D